MNRWWKQTHDVDRVGKSEWEAGKSVVEMTPTTLENQPGQYHELTWQIIMYHTAIATAISTQMLAANLFDTNTHVPNFRINKCDSMKQLYNQNLFVDI